MAAYAALLSLTQTLSQSPVVPQTEHHVIGYLHEKLNFLLSFPEEDYAEKNSETFRCLEGRIRDMTYEAEDIIESQISNQIRSESGIEEFKFEGLQKIIGELDIILEEVAKMKDIYHTEDQPRNKSFSSASSRSVPTNSSTMVGFYDELRQIKDQLTGSSSKLEIISIVGMGGIGKTTLARNVYDDSLILYHFHTRAWIMYLKSITSRKCSQAF